MNTVMLKRVRRAYPSHCAPANVVRHNRRAWVRSIRYLGPKWLLATPTPKQETTC